MFIHFAVYDTVSVLPLTPDRIFESFTQADDTIINRFGGTGLGLSICRQPITAIGVRSVTSQEWPRAVLLVHSPDEQIPNQNDLSQQLSQVPPHFCWVCSNTDLVVTLRHVLALTAISSRWHAGRLEANMRKETYQRAVGKSTTAIPPEEFCEIGEREPLWLT